MRHLQKITGGEADDVSLTCNALLLIPTNPAVISPWDFVMQPFGSCFQRTVTLCDTNSKSLPAKSLRSE